MRSFSGWRVKVIPCIIWLSVFFSFVPYKIKLYEPEKMDNGTYFECSEPQQQNETTSGSSCKLMPSVHANL